jgi:hypothetical protein
MSQTVTPSAPTSTFLGSNPGLARLYDNIQATVPAVSLPLITMETWNTIEDFYIRSTAKRETVYWTMQPGTQQVDFNPFDSNWLVAWVLEVSGLPRWKIDMPALLTDMSLNSQLGLRQGCALLALKPVSYSSQLPPELFQQYFETILSGVLFRLHALPTKPWSSPQLASFHGKKYSAGIAAARGLAIKGYSDGASWRFPAMQGFAVGRRKN